MERLKLSLVIPAHNEAAYLPACLDAILKQHIDIPHEIIVVDNASTDTTAQVASAAGVRVVSEPKKGLSYARQRGLEAAQGEILMYIDADTRLPDGWITIVFTYLTSHPGVVAVSTALSYYDGRLIENVGLLISRVIILPFTKLVLGSMHKPELLFGSAFALRRDVLQDAGGINTNIVFYGEDIAIAMRMNNYGKVKLLLSPLAPTSARRYVRLGPFKTYFTYMRILFLVLFGDFEKYLKLSNQMSKSQE